LIHTSGLRLCFRAQWEIRMLFTYIKREVKKVDRFIADFLQPRCIHLGYCPEKKTCGLRPLKREVIKDG
ncbi:FAD-dependent thymidylate synthase, partial [candidate division WOR-3 bacterium]|nr:FAD-dependent thymidylate synthase [candidate division WOR-3 bacterium]